MKGAIVIDWGGFNKDEFELNSDSSTAEFNRLYMCDFKPSDEVKENICNKSCETIRRRTGKN